MPPKKGKKGKKGKKSSKKADGEEPKNTENDEFRVELPRFRWILIDVSPICDEGQLPRAPPVVSSAAECAVLVSCT